MKVGFAVETRGLAKHYGARRALDGMDLAVPAGSVTGLIGPNGAGKTTWMMSLVGFLLPTEGQIDLLGAGAFDPAVHGGRVTILPQDSELPLESRPLELLTHYGMLQGMTRDDARRSARKVLDEVHLGDRLGATVRSLSHGMRKRVMIAQCFLGDPELVLLDEPLSGLDPREVAHMRSFLVRRRGRQTVVISSHSLHDIEQMCDHIAFMEQGRAIRMATLDEITGRSSVLVYELPAGEVQMEPVAAAAEPLEASVEWEAATRRLTCRYDARRLAAEEVNNALLPVLLAQSGVVSVTRGASLETQYLKSLPAADDAL